MTPCEKRGWKAGDRFRVVEKCHQVFDFGETVSLSIDDGSHCPLFEGYDTSHRSYIDVGGVEPIAPNWTGPADGLPPVGAVCEGDHRDYGWVKGVVIGHDNAERVVVLKTKYGYDGYSILRPLKSDRERAIDQLSTDILTIWQPGASAKSLAEPLYDLGYRKTEAES